MEQLVTKIKNFGLAPNDIAERAGLLLDRVIGILQGNIEPTLQDIRKIAKALKISPDFLINDDKEIPNLDVLYRKTLNENKQTGSKLTYIVNNCLSILGDDYIPSAALQEFTNIEPTFEGARALAEKFRKLFFNSDFVGPLLNLPEIIVRNLNCIVLIQDLGNGTDGASVKVNNIPIIVVSPRFEARMFFTLAHELGHILAHHNERNFAIIDSDIVVNRKRLKSEEAFAHAFASEVLMPRVGVGIALKTIRESLKIAGDNIGEIEFLYLSRLYGVSFEVAALRCENLGLAPRGTAASLYESVSKEHKNPEERARRLRLPQRPKIVFPRISTNLIKPAIEKIKHGEISLEKAAELLNSSVVDIINYNSQMDEHNS